MQYCIFLVFSIFEGAFSTVAAARRLAKWQTIIYNYSYPLSKG